MGKKIIQDISDKEIRDSAVTLCSYSSNNIPYRGVVISHPTFGPIVNANYTETNIIILPDTKPIPSFSDIYTLEQKLSVAATTTSFMSFVATAAGVAQANKEWYIFDNKIIKVTAKTVNTSNFRLAQEMGKISKSVGTAISYINVGITLAQVGTQGLDENTGTDIVICTIGFVPGVGWVICGVYTIANVAVTAVTGKSIPTHVQETLFEKWCRFNHELENIILNWVRPPFF